MLSGVGSFTSACGITVYLGGAFPSLGLFSLTAEPAQNLVHRDVLSPAGASYMAKRAREGVEFLASTDAWFRPVNFYIGPDGAIYLLDYYRLVIEHPEWMATQTYIRRTCTRATTAAASTALLRNRRCPSRQDPARARRPTKNW